MSEEICNISKYFIGPALQCSQPTSNPRLLIVWMCGKPKCLHWPALNTPECFVRQAPCSDAKSMGLGQQYCAKAAPEQSNTTAGPAKPYTHALCLPAWHLPAASSILKVLSARQPRTVVVTSARPSLKRHQSTSNMKSIIPGIPAHVPSLSWCCHDGHPQAIMGLHLMASCMCTEAIYLGSVWKVAG